MAERTGLEPVGVAISGQLWGIGAQSTRLARPYRDKAKPERPERSTKTVYHVSPFTLRVGQKVVFQSRKRHEFNGRTGEVTAVYRILLSAYVRWDDSEKENLVVMWFLKRR